MASPVGPELAGRLSSPMGGLSGVGAESAGSTASVEAAVVAAAAVAVAAAAGSPLRKEGKSFLRRKPKEEPKPMAKPEKVEEAPHSRPAYMVSAGRVDAEAKPGMCAPWGAALPPPRSAGSLLASRLHEWPHAAAHGLRCGMARRRRRRDRLAGRAGARCSREPPRLRPARRPRAADADRRGRAAQRHRRGQGGGALPAARRGHLATRGGGQRRLAARAVAVRWARGGCEADARGCAGRWAARDVRGAA
jgi:hypothetical protein